MVKHILSKSTFMYGVQCPLRLYLHKFKPELKNLEEADQKAIFAMGTSVGLIAQQYIPGGIDVSPPDPYSYHISVAKTEELIKQGQKVIYEAAFNFDGVLCAVDILAKIKGRWCAFEVKATLDPKDQHIMDASLQYYVLTNCGIKLKDFSILNLNREYVRRGELDVQQLFKPTSGLNQILENQPFIREKAEELKELVRNKKEPIIQVGDQCDDPYPCDFTEHCWKNIEEEIEEKIYPKIINKDAISEFLHSLEYPLHFLDFETVMHAVPPFNESRPMQHLPFQYSLHVISDKGSEAVHKEFLGNGIDDPREDLLDQLINDLGNKGTVLAWYLPFENSRLKDLARDFPKYAKEIEVIQKRTNDLYIPFKKKMYRLPEFNGSSSIKDVLPVLVPELSYKDLEIQEGGTASSTYASFREQTPEEQERLRKALLDYCHLDTLAMVKIFEKLNEI